MATTFAVSTVVIVLTPLVAIFGYLVYKGMGSVNWAFLTQTPKPPGELGGGMANAIAGSVLILSHWKPDGRAPGHRSGHLPGRIRAESLWRSGAICLRRFERRALDRDRHRGLRVWWCCGRNTSRRWPAVLRWPS